MSTRHRLVIAFLALGVVAVYALGAAIAFRLPAPAEEGDAAAGAPVQAPVTQIVVIASPIASPSAPAIASVPTFTAVPTTKPSPTATRAPTPTPPVPAFLSDYLRNVTYAEVVEARPWTNTSLNVWQYSLELGGVSVWDYFASKFGQGFDEEWSSSRYGWLDDAGNWQRYRQETIQDARGNNVAAYVIVDRPGTGVVDKMVFTMYSVASRPGEKDPDLAEWGYLGHLGRIRIEVDGRIAYDVPIAEWFSGAALCLPTDLARLFFWRYSDFGSNGSIVPIPYQNHVKISVYGGIEKPKWFTFTGVTLPPGTAVKPLAGCLDATTMNSLRALAPNVTAPEDFVSRAGTVETADLSPRVVARNAPDVPFAAEARAARLEFEGRGTLTAIQLRVPKDYDLTALWLRVRYGNATAIDLPFIAFFGDQDRVVPHRSTPMGVVEDAGSYVFYSNYPMPYQRGMAIEISTRGEPVVIRARYARSPVAADTQLVALYDDFRNRPALRPLSPDYVVTLPGNGKLVALTLATRDFVFDPHVIPSPPPEVSVGTIVFPQGLFESNVTFKDGRGVTRVYSGLEDFADGGYAFDSAQGPGMHNLPFAGVFAFSWDPPERGYMTLFRYFNDLSAFRFRQGVTLAFQHGTWKNNFPVRYGVMALWYAE